MQVLHRIIYLSYISANQSCLSQNYLLQQSSGFFLFLDSRDLYRQVKFNFTNRTQRDKCYDLLLFKHTTLSYATLYIIINIPSDRNKDISYATIIIYIPSDRNKDISYATIIINIPSDRNKDISYATIIIYTPSDRNKDISYATIIIYIPSDR